MILSTEKNLKEHGSKIPKEDKIKIEKSLDDLKKTLENDKTDNKILKEKTDSLVQSSMKLGEILYKEAQEKAEKEKAEKEKATSSNKKNDNKSKNGASNAKNSKDAKVVDADFEDVTEKKPTNDKNEKKSDDKNTGKPA